MKRLENKIALVTGGTTGIGLAAAKRLAEEGAVVYVTGRREAELNAAVVEIGHGAKGVQGDASKLEDLDRLYAQIENEQGKLDVLFANAGGGTFSKLGEITEAQFDQEFGINVKGLLFTVQKALPLLKSGGSIILNASIVAEKGMENFSVYSATKAAVRSFARTWTSDLKGTGIRVNAVSPGPIRTPGLAGLFGGDAQGAENAMAAAIPQGRLGDPSEIGDAVVFLASTESSYISGINLVVDGGMSQI